MDTRISSNFAPRNFPLLLLPSVDNIVSAKGKGHGEMVQAEHPAQRRFSQWLGEMCDNYGVKARSLHHAFIREGGVADLKTVKRWLAGMGGGPKAEDERLVVAALMLLVPEPQQVRSAYMEFVAECLDARPLWLSQTEWLPSSGNDQTGRFVGIGQSLAPLAPFEAVA